jgi:spore coat protein B
MSEQMQSYLESLRDKIVRFDRGGPESRIGKLLDVYPDYLVLLTDEDGVVYYKTHHLKSITEEVKYGLPFYTEVPEGFSYITADNFHQLLSEMRNKWITINRGGHEKLSGVLSDISDDYVTMVVGSEVIRLSTFHIRNFSYGLKPEPPAPEEEVLGEVQHVPGQKKS